MPVFKNESNGTWYVMARYVNWKGERKQKCKRGFATKKEAQEWERMFQLQNSSDMDMSFKAFTELYIRDMKSRLKENTWLTKEHIIRTKILPYFGKLKISEQAAYTDKEHVAAYINEFAKLPHNYITKNQAKKLGWQTKGTLDKVAPGKSIGGDRYGNYEGLLPKKNGRVWTECDIDYVKGNRNAKRIVFSNDGLIYYTGDHYKTFTKLY